MSNIEFLIWLGCLLLLFLGWGFRHLPGERWQMLAVVPLKKNDQNGWLGANLTYYGFFVATSQLISCCLLLVLLQAQNISIGGAIISTLIILALCVPAARIVAMIVEKKRHTFTIGGASFVGVILAPWVILVTGELLKSHESIYLPLLPVLSAMSIAYTLGEGLGRLGCISYGCCYGKPVQDANPFIRFVFRRLNFIFYGMNKKVAYEGQLEGEKLIPVQAVTCILYTVGALTGSYLYLCGLFTEALLLTMVITQMWRILSETLRADFRGFGNISAYQKMGVVSVLYIFCIVMFADPASEVLPNIAEGVQVLWNPGVIIGLQLLWGVFFLCFGRSTVTSSTVSFELIRENI